MPKIYQLTPRDVASLHSLALNNNPAAMARNHPKFFAGSNLMPAHVRFEDQAQTESRAERLAALGLKAREEVLALDDKGLSIGQQQDLIAKVASEFIVAVFDILMDKPHG